MKSNVKSHFLFSFILFNSMRTIERNLMVLIAWKLRIRNQFHSFGSMYRGTIDTICDPLLYWWESNKRASLEVTYVININGFQLRNIDKGN